MSQAKQTKRVTPQEAKQKIYRYCAYQERSHKEVKEKLYAMHLYASEVDELLTHLITEGFLNEERFARAYAGGKFRMKHWGRRKITHGLEAKGVSANCVRLALQEIDDTDYMQTLRTLLQRKMEELHEPDAYIKRDRIARFAIQKGYESELVWELVKGIKV